MKVFVAHTEFQVKDRKVLFILTRPFFNEKNWVNDATLKTSWGLNPDQFQLVSTIENATIVLIPFAINFYYKEKKEFHLEALHKQCLKHNKKAYGYIVGDLGIAFPEFATITYLRPSGFKSQLSTQNKGFYIPLTDQLPLLFHQEHCKPSPKKEVPIVGFCGHARLHFSKLLFETTRFMLCNLWRFYKKPNRNDWEPLFPSGFHRAKLLQLIDQSSNTLQTNFIYRSQYRAGVQTKEQETQSTLEYFQNILESDYILCVRGAGNFSVRLYETLMMGKIPIFVNTDCMLPFESTINWKKHVVWIEWNERKTIAERVTAFHASITAEDFVQLQINNRKLWKETLSIASIIKRLADDF